MEVILLMCVINSIGGAPLQPQKSTQFSPFYHYVPHTYTSPPAILHPEHRKHFENGNGADSELFYKDVNWHWNS